MNFAIIIIVIGLFYFIYNSLKGNFLGTSKSEFKTIGTKIESIKNYSTPSGQQIFQIHSFGELDGKMTEFVSPKYYFDITKNLKVGDKIEVEVDLKKPQNYRFLDDQLFD